jgi:hypothetical protein
VASPQYGQAPEAHVVSVTTFTTAKQGVWNRISCRMSFVAADPFLPIAVCRIRATPIE